MKAVIAIQAHGGYEVGDVLIIAPSNYQFGPNDLRPGYRESVEVGVLSEEEQVLLRMGDERPWATWAIMRVPTFRHHTFKPYYTSIVKRRKYKFDTNYNVVKK